MNEYQITIRSDRGTQTIPFGLGFTEAWAYAFKVVNERVANGDIVHAVAVEVCRYG